MAQLHETSGCRDVGPPGHAIGVPPPATSVRLGLEPGRAASWRPAERGPAALVVHKTMTDRDAFGAQVRWLTRSRSHPVAKLCHIEAPALTYTTRFEGSHTLATAADGPRTGRPLLRRLAEILVGLHACDLAHGNLEPGHIVVQGRRLTLISPGSRGGDSSEGRRHDVTRFGTAMAHLVELWSVLGRADRDVLDQWRDAADRISGGEMRSAGRLPEIVEGLPVARRRSWLSSTH